MGALQGWSLVYLLASLCTKHVFDMNTFYILNCNGGGGGLMVLPQKIFKFQIVTNPVFLFKNATAGKLSICDN